MPCPEVYHTVLQVPFGVNLCMVQLKTWHHTHWHVALFGFVCGGLCNVPRCRRSSELDLARASCASRHISQSAIDDHTRYNNHITCSHESIQCYVLVTSPLSYRKDGYRKRNQTQKNLLTLLFFCCFFCFTYTCHNQMSDTY